MPEIWGAIERFFGLLLDWIYRGVPNYGVAIILLTIVTRAAIAPLGVKQIRSMQKMQKIQPELKKLQTKYKGDRQKLNEEMMKLYKEHGVNPLGGCFPMIAQMPMFIALYAVIRSFVPVTAAPAVTIPVGSIPKTVICEPNTFPPSVSGPTPTAVVCQEKGGPQTYSISEWRQGHTGLLITPPPYLARCGARTSQGKTDFACVSPLGTGHLPQDGKLFKALVADKATFLGMRLACSPNQISTSAGAKACTTSGKKAGGGGMIMYYLLVLLMAGSTYYQQLQMQQRQPQSQQAQQMKMMMTVMPVLFGFLSLQFPAALSIYWITGNAWTIVQQHFVFRGEEPPAPAPKTNKKKGKR